MIIIDNKFNIGEQVYLITDNEQFPRIIIDIRVHPNESILYDVSFGTVNSLHYEFELSKEKQCVAP